MIDGQVTIRSWRRLFLGIGSIGFGPRWDMPSPTTVLIIELDEALADLEREVLHNEGYEAIPMVCGPASMQSVKTINPDVIVLDLGFDTQSCGWQLLGELRSYPDTQGIPLLVISDTEPLLEHAQQSFNVRQEIIKPHGITDLINGVQAAVAGTPLLPHPAPPPTNEKISVEAAQVISREAIHIMAEWLRRAQQEKVLGSPPNVPIRILINNVSVWLIGMVSVLRYGPDQLGTPEIHAKLATHIQEVQGHEVTLAQMIKQFEILRDVTWETLKHSWLANLTTQDVFALAQTVNTALDEVLAQVAVQYGA